MRLAISNLAWPSGADEAAASILARHGVREVEIAPGKVWPAPVETSRKEVLAYRAAWESRGVSIVALQALLFGQPELTLFDTPERRRRMAEYLGRVIERAAWLGARVLVFGSPGSRRRGALGLAEAHGIAVPFFREVGGMAAAHGVTFCIEPNPTEYGCDFVTNATEGLELVETVGSEGFGLHLDAAGLTLSGDGPATVRRMGARCMHFHASEPFLRQVGPGNVPHAEFADVLCGLGYAGCVSIEMNETNLSPTWQEGVERALAFVSLTCSLGKQEAHEPRPSGSGLVAH
jgi:D-psicose/D-tagatose/L-ribulose 3-epimerase